MRTRNKKLADYGLTREDVRRIKGYCRETPGCADAVAFIAGNVNDQIAGALTESICCGKSYEDLAVYMAKNDFYAYRRKCFAVIKKMMVENGIWEREAG